MTLSKSTAWLFTGIAALALEPAAASAQTQAADTPTNAETAADNNAIIVTAQRRTEDAMKVPVAVSVLKPEALHDYQAAGADTLLSLSGRVPSLYVDDTTGRIFPRFYIRGLGNIDFYLGASQPVSIIQDDVVEEHVVLKSNPAFDIAQVEVLKGPQGSLFGRNTTAGIIKFDTAQPSETWQGQGSVSYGKFNSVNADVGVGGPLTQDGRVSFRLSGLYQHRDDWIDNVYTGPTDDGTKPGKNVLGGYDERDVRLQLLFKPTEDLSIRLSGHYRDYDGTATPFYRGSIKVGTDAVPSDFDRGQVANDEAHNNPQSYKTHGVSLKAAYDFSGITLTSITAWEHAAGYSLGDTDGGAAANFGGVAPNYCAAGCGMSQGHLRGLDQWSEEVRLASDDTGRFKWQVGGIYFDSRDHTEFDQRTFFLTSNALGTAPNPNNFVLLHDVNKSWAAFGQASYALTDQLTLTGGVRVTKDTKTTDLLEHPNFAKLAVPVTAPTSSYECGANTHCRLSDTKPSWDASLLYRFNPEISLYARVARGFRGPTIQGRSAVFATAYSTANSETNTSYEAGFKTAFLDNKVHFNVSGFYYEVKNIQLNGNDSNGNGVLFNANKGKGYGMEAELDAKPMQNLHLNAGLSLLHTEIDDKGVFAQVGAAGGVLSETVLNPVVKVGSNYFAQINGNPFPNAPDYNLNLSARYDFPITETSRVFVGGDFNMQGKTNFVAYRSVEYRADGNYELGAKIGYAFKTYEVAVFARNLTNQKNLIDVIDTSNYRAGIYNEPRVFGVTLSGSFR
ncbi:TonB-dependent receptor [Sphingomonas sp. CGMCC 1.13654]|uniref:TonB-dependent receptor n=1 Tax=Sphingomonas chungangi TaxID=2683589 RepID=A0A838L6T9_9SPHN|nr:TonB-dependent receptor [Sphingomonas chungangi]MBA2933866.1 TonB-dependent receptor [Sphingomonas chungangi]MVW55196.1 TonB-dependent receptor [Sphingomonas chungangi]